MIKAIVFDQGGIIIDVDYQKTVDAFKQLGATNPEQIYTQAEQTDYVDQFERGKISTVEFRHLLRQNLEGLPHTTSDEQIDAAWNAMLLHYNEDRIKLIQGFKDNGYITCMFANIDEIHNRGCIAAAERDGVGSLLNACFHEKYLSHEFGYNKPNADSFRRIADDLQQKHGISPREILFIDDSKKHIYGRDGHDNEGALSAGWHGIWAPQNLSSNELKELIINKIQEVAQYKEDTTVNILSKL